MVSFAALWLPILLAAVIVFIASSIIHMVLPYHRSNYRKLPDEESVRTLFRGAQLTPGLYHVPYCTHKETNSPETKAKFKEGPVVLMTVFPNGAVNMGKFLGQWFAYCVLDSFLTAYLAAHAVAFLHWGITFRVGFCWRSGGGRCAHTGAPDIAAASCGRLSGRAGRGKPVYRRAGGSAVRDELSQRLRNGARRAEPRRRHACRCTAMRAGACGGTVAQCRKAGAGVDAQ